MKSTIFIIFTLALVTSATDYCAKCSNHVACNNNGQFRGNCPRDAALVPMTDSAKQTLLQTHNSLRNRIAGGGQAGFNQASKMMALVSKTFE